MAYLNIDCIQIEPTRRWTISIYGETVPNKIARSILSMSIFYIQIIIINAINIDVTNGKAHEFWLAIFHAFWKLHQTETIACIQFLTFWRIRVTTLDGNENDKR